MNEPGRCKASLPNVPHTHHTPHHIVRLARGPRDSRQAAPVFGLAERGVVRHPCGACPAGAMGHSRSGARAQAGTCQQPLPHRSAFRAQRHARLAPRRPHREASAANDDAARNKQPCAWFRCPWALTQHLQTGEHAARHQVSKLTPSVTSERALPKRRRGRGRACAGLGDTHHTSTQ